MQQELSHTPAHHDWHVIGETDHCVQFYDDDAFLMASVAQFIGGGVGAGHGAIVIATPDHCSDLETLLDKQGIDVFAVKDRGQLLVLDAEECLARFMVKGMPDPHLFQQVVGAAVARVAGQYKSLRAFGEMVAVLWAQGNSKAAIRLEKLWDNLRERQAFSLVCAYPTQVFNGMDGSMQQVCREHTHVLPVAAGHTIDERLQEIAHLENQAKALASELEERKRVEEDLRRHNAQLTALIESASVGLHWVNPSGVILWANPADYEMLGYTRAEYVGRHIAAFHADQTAIGELLMRLSRGERIRNFPAQLKCKDGSLKNVLIDTSGYWESGRFMHTQCITREVGQT